MMKFIIYSEPVAQGRPRFTTRGGFPRAYDPPVSRDFKNYSKFVLSDTMRKHNWKMIDEACILSVKTYKTIPKSYSKKKTLACQNGTLRPITKPDLDNYIKGIKDSMKSIVWRDDSLIVGYFDCGKYYVENFKDPRVEIIVETLDEYFTRNNSRKKLVETIYNLSNEDFLYLSNNFDEFISNKKEEED